MTPIPTIPKTFSTGKNGFHNINIEYGKGTFRSFSRKCRKEKKF